MQNTELIILGSIGLPFIASFLNYVFRTSENLRDSVTFILSAITFFCVVNIGFSYTEGNSFDFSLLSVMPGLEIAFKVEPLGLLFAIIALSLIHI